MIDREINRMDRWIREAIHIRKEQYKSMNRDEGSYQLPHIYDYLLSTWQTVVLTKAEAIVETATKTIILLYFDCILMNLL